MWFSLLYLRDLLWAIIGDVYFDWVGSVCDGFQEGIRDKLRAIPIEVFVAIQSAKRGKRQSSLPQLVPILDSTVSNKTIAEVRTVTVDWVS